MVLQRAEHLGACFRADVKGRDALLEFMDGNGWFGLKVRFIGKEIFVAGDTGSLERALPLWLKAYGQNREIKLGMLLDALRDRFPGTCRRLEAFLDADGNRQKTAALPMADFLLSSLNKEVTSCSQEEIEKLVAAGNVRLGIHVMTMFNEFLQYPVNGKTLSDWSFHPVSRQIIKVRNDAYSMEEFSVIAYTVFNRESWIRNSLIEKACMKKRYAQMWLFTAMHFVGGIRSADIVRLPVPSLPYDGGEIRQRIREGIYTEDEARDVTEEFLFLLEMKPKGPHKTAGRYTVPDVKVTVPTSLRAPLGIIMSLALSYRKDGDPFVDERSVPMDGKAFFGEDFFKAVSGKNFLSRRGNKAYLQGIELEGSDDEAGKPKGYMLAALARSHKGGIGALPEVTDVYLKDAMFTGYSPKFILMEMFERGIFGFIPALLLEMYAGKSYRRLGVSGQTKLIREIGLDAVELEAVSGLVENSFHESQKIVGELFDGCSGEKLGKTLQRVASGAAPAKHSEALCLLTAAGQPCADVCRGSCIGCSYEIYTKSSMHMLMREYRGIMERLAETEGTEAKRLKMILKNGILPAVGEILESIPILYPDADMDPLYEIAERGMCIADRSE